MKPILSALAGLLASESWERRVLAPEIVISVSMSEALRIVRGLYTSVEPTDDRGPVCLLSAGWGSRSTLLQRLIMTDKQTMLWNGSVDHAVAVCRLAQMISSARDLVLTPSFSPKFDYRYTAHNRGDIIGESGNSNQINIWLAYPPNSLTR